MLFEERAQGQVEALPVLHAPEDVGAGPGPAPQALIALRQQVEALKRRRPRPQLDDADRASWLALRSAWRGWAARLILVQPDTVVRWHRDRFRRYWSKVSRHSPGPGRPRVDSDVRELIRRSTLESDWGAPRIHGELERLGFAVSEATVSRYMPQRPTALHPGPALGP